MTRKNNTLLEQGASCLAMLSLAFTNTPFIPRNIKRPLALFILLVLVLLWLVEYWKRTNYSEKELEREKYDERNQMIQTQAVWYCHVVEDWTLLGLFVIFGIYAQNDALAYTMMWILVARCFFSFAIRWWLDRKY